MQQLLLGALESVALTGGITMPAISMPDVPAIWAMPSEQAPRTAAGMITNANVSITATSLDWWFILVDSKKQAK